ncbi:MAG TPA: VOC family protein [Mycobacteriales bacterium]|jgi:predicted enzyme related to lactoylglutathione lyase|nr:VOC family protein [Mycobacteriales bacterium]
MSERNGYPQGVPCWADVATDDPEAGRAFYAALFGWEWEVNPDPSFGGYSMALLRGKKVVGLAGKMDASQPSAWTPYLAVDDADKFAAAVPDAGGTMVSPVMDIEGAGRMALATDPAGAVFGVWQQQEHRGSELVDEPGTVVWNELISSDLDAAGAFFAATLGVAFEDMDTGGDGVYKLLQVDGRTVGGATPLLPEMSPHWGIWFEVADADATLARAQELGGSVYRAVEQTPQGPRAVLVDPQGVAFGVIASGSTE